MKNRNHIMLVLLFSFITGMANAAPEEVSDTLATLTLEEKLAYLSLTDKAFASEIDISLGNTALSELIRLVAISSGVNINVKDVDNVAVNCNFERVKVCDLILYLCREYRLDIDISGNIVVLHPKVIPPKKPKPLDISYDNVSGHLSLNLSRDTLICVVRRIVELSRANIIVPQSLCNMTVTVYVLDMPIQQAVMSLASANGLTCTLDGDKGAWLLEMENQNSSKNYRSGRQMTEVRMMALVSRSVSQVEEIIPDELKKDVQIKQFPDLNSLIVCGEQAQVGRLSDFVSEIDVPVPLISMEIMMIEVIKNDIMEAGLGVGLKSEATGPTTGTFSPGIDLSIGATTVNRLISKLNGIGSFNLGSVGANFYMDIKALEDRGVIEIQSTPKLATLNGHEASLTSGEKQYYKEVNNSYIGSLSPVQSESYQWKDVDANMTIKITPFVSEAGTITLDVDISQTEFTDRIEKNAPPGTTSRGFKSIIKVQDGDMVLLGGIERNSREKSSKGLPWIARVPVLKWLFGNAKDSNVGHKLSVFIKPTIIY